MCNDKVKTRIKLMNILKTVGFNVEMNPTTDELIIYNSNDVKLIQYKNDSGHNSDNFVDDINLIAQI